MNPPDHAAPGDASRDAPPAAGADILVSLRQVSKTYHRGQQAVPVLDTHSKRQPMRWRKAISFSRGAAETQTIATSRWLR